MSSVKVAVRVRPFNARETGMNSTLIVRMDGKTTYLKNPVSVLKFQSSRSFNTCFMCVS